jgi:hypothetical protein
MLIFLHLTACQPQNSFAPQRRIGAGELLFVVSDAKGG